MSIFNSYVKLPEGIINDHLWNNLAAQRQGHAALLSLRMRCYSLHGAHRRWTTSPSPVSPCGSHAGGASKFDQWSGCGYGSPSWPENHHAISTWFSHWERLGMEHPLNMYLYVFIIDDFPNNNAWFLMFFFQPTTFEYQRVLGSKRSGVGSTEFL